VKITAVRASWLSARGAVLAPERAGLGLTLRREFVRAITVA